MASFVIRMKFHMNKFLTTVSAVALVLAVGACSSNGDDDGISAERDTALEDLKAAQAKVDSLTEDLATANSNLGIANSNLETATGRVMDLETLIGEEMDPAAESLRGMLAQANMALDGANTALQMAMDNSVDGMEIARLTTAVTDAETMRDGYKGMVDAANLELDGDADTEGLRDVVTRLELALAKIKMETETVRNAMTLADTIAREDKVKMAIDLSRVEADTAVAIPSGGDVTGVTATRNPAGMVTVDVNGDDADDYTGGETTAGSGDWNSATLTKGTNTLVVYTNVEAPSDQDFADAYLPAVLNDALLAATVGKVAAAGFPSEPDTSWEYTGEEGGREKTVVGTFDGVDGQFTCTSVACRVMTDGMGELVATANWEFRADSQNTATVKKADAAYAYFGWWLNKPEDNMATHMTEVFAGAVGDAAAVETMAIMGTAKYAGPAAGKYATKTFTAGVQTDAGVGHFTANAALTAKFGDANFVGTIDGSVTGFELDDGSSPTWKVILEQATISGASFNGTSEVDFGGGATATQDGAGKWAGSFYDAATENDEAPGTVVGRFDAVIPNASLIGAFGATKQ